MASENQPTATATTFFWTPSVLFKRTTGAAESTLMSGLGKSVVHDK